MVKIIACVRWGMGLETLKYLKKKYQLVAVISDEPTGDKYNRASNFCIENEIPFFASNSNWEDVFNLEYDLVISCSFNKLIKKDYVLKAKYGGLNIHQSLLPKYRGRSPVLSAILDGEQFIGLTIHELTDEFDEGPIFYQTKWLLDYNLTLEEVYRMYIKAIPTALEQSIYLKLKGNVGVIQESSNVSFAYNFSGIEVDWTNPLSQVREKLLELVKEG